MSLEGARVGATIRTIPNAVKAISVGTGGTEIDLGAAVTADDGDVTPTVLGGKWIYLKARGGDVTILRKGSTITTNGVGLVLKDGDVAQEFFVNPSGTMKLDAIAGSTVHLDLLYDTNRLEVP